MSHRSIKTLMTDLVVTIQGRTPSVDAHGKLSRADGVKKRDRQHGEPWSFGDDDSVARSAGVVFGRPQAVGA